MLVETHFPDVHRPALEATWRRWHRQGVIERIWDGDPSVWGRGDVPELADRLGWLRLHETMRPRLDEFRTLADQAASEASDVVLLGMGGSSLAPEVFAEMFGPVEGRPWFRVLDSTHPEAVKAVTDAIDLSRSWFVVSSKSGSTLETLSYFRHFWAATGGDGSRFVAITDPGTSLQKLGEEREFRAVVNAPPDVGGRYSALTPFGLVPAAMIGVDVEGLLDAASGLATRSRAHPAELAVDLGAMWGVLAAAGRDKLTVVTSKSLSAFPAWLEQLVAESLGKVGTGIVPVAGEAVPAPGGYGADRQFLSYRLQGEPAVFDVDAMVDDGHPVVRIELGDRVALGREMLRAELATAAAGEVLGVHPFDQPDVEAAKQLARAAMAGETTGTPMPTVDAATIGSGLAAFVDGSRPGDYLGLQAYLPMDVVDDRLDRLRRAMGERGGVATTFGFGPRFLHSTGQLHKGGAGGRFVQLVDRSSTTVPVPETDHEFGRIIAAQAAGDAAALADAGKPVLRIDLGSDRQAGLDALLESLR